MNIWHLIVRELAYRKVNFLLAVIAVVVAVGCLVAQITVLQAHDQVTENVLGEKKEKMEVRLASEESATKKRLGKLEDDYRKIMIKLGFNVLILPESQDLYEMTEKGYPTQTMPEDYAQKLSKSKVMTINHLLPLVQKIVRWDEKKQTVLLMGIRDEVPLGHANPKKQLIQPIPAKHMVLGNLLGERLKLKKGEKVVFLGLDFTIHKIHEERGNRDDMTIWINLDEAQKLLGMEGKINAMLALECNCATLDRLGEIRAEIQKVLPGTQVREKQGEAVTRAEARNRARKEANDALAAKKEQAAAALEAEEAGRNQIRGQYEMFAAVLIPLALVGALLWLGFITLGNIRERQSEIGILRAMGLSANHVYVLFLARALLVGILGALAGYLIGLAVGWSWAERTMEISPELRFNPILVVGVFLFAPLLCILVGWLATRLAAQQDPAIILQQD